MKKILLALFLMLGVVSFAALQLDTNKLQKKAMRQQTKMSMLLH